MGQELRSKVLAEMERIVALEFTRGGDADVKSTCRHGVVGDSLDSEGQPGNGESMADVYEEKPLANGTTSRTIIGTVHVQLAGDEVADSWFLASGD